MTPRLLTTLLVLILAIPFGLYLIRSKPSLEVGGVWEEVRDVGEEPPRICKWDGGIRWHKSDRNEIDWDESKPLFWLLELGLTGNSI